MMNLSDLHLKKLYNDIKEMNSIAYKVSAGEG